MRYGSSRVTAKTEAVVVVAKKRRRGRPKISVKVERDARDPRRHGACGARRFFVRGL
jgi:hypothetical protein